MLQQRIWYQRINVTGYGVRALVRRRKRRRWNELHQKWNLRRERATITTTVIIIIIQNVSPDSVRGCVVDTVRTYGLRYASYQMRARAMETRLQPTRGAHNVLTDTARHQCLASRGNRNREGLSSARLIVRLLFFKSRSRSQHGVRTH